MSLTTRSGTNQFHGDVFYVNRNDALEARNFFFAKLPEDKQNEGGWTVGGPVYIPKVYNGQNKTFFFASMDIYRYVTRATSQGGVVPLATVPSVLERQGDFTEALGSQIGTDALGRPIFKGEIYDPTTTRLLPDGTLIRDPFMYKGHLNVIPPENFSQISPFFQDSIALPTGPGIVNNFAALPARTYVQKDQWSLKLDQLIGQKHRLMFSVEKQFHSLFPDGTGVTGHSFKVGGPAYLGPELSSQYIDDRGEYRYRFSYVWSLKPNVLMSFRAGITRNPNRTQYPLPLTGEGSTGACDAGLKGTLSCRTPGVSITNNLSWGPGGGGFYVIKSQRTPATLDLAWTRGNHDYQFGVNYVTMPFTYAVNQAYGRELQPDYDGPSKLPQHGSGVCQLLAGISQQLQCDVSDRRKMEHFGRCSLCAGQMAGDQQSYDQLWFALGDHGALA
jgi:hypothetical protein